MRFKVRLLLCPRFAFNVVLGMDATNPKPVFSHFVRELRARHPDLAYIHGVEPRVHGLGDKKEEDIRPEEENDFIRNIIRPIPFISAGGYQANTALATAEEKGGLVAFGRWFISNVRIAFYPCFGYSDAYCYSRTSYTAFENIFRLRHMIEARSTHLSRLLDISIMVSTARVRVKGPACKSWKHRIDWVEHSNDYERNNDSFIAKTVHYTVSSSPYEYLYLGK